MNSRSEPVRQDNECLICARIVQLKQLNCSHELCELCIKDIYAESGRCPICNYKFKILDAPTKESHEYKPRQLNVTISPPSALEAKITEYKKKLDAYQTQVANFNEREIRLEALAKKGYEINLWKYQPPIPPLMDFVPYYCVSKKHDLQAFRGLDYTKDTSILGEVEEKCYNGIKGHMKALSSAQMKYLCNHDVYGGYNICVLDDQPILIVAVTCYVNFYRMIDNKWRLQDIELPFADSYDFVTEDLIITVEDNGVITLISLNTGDTLYHEEYSMSSPPCFNGVTTDLGIAFSDKYGTYVLYPSPARSAG
jgi:hypothetical protein